jgi:serine protease
MNPTCRLIGVTTLTLAILLLLSGPPAMALLGDVDGSGRIDGMDLILFAHTFGALHGEERYELTADFNQTGDIDGLDLIILANNFGSTAAEEANLEFAPNEVLVKFTGAGSDRMQEILALENAAVKKHYPRCGVHLVTFNNGLSEEVTAARLMVHQEVEYAERNLLCRPSWRPNDPLFSNQWNFAQIEMEGAWDLNRGGSPSVIVAVIDSGVAYENFGQFGRAPDLAGVNFVHSWDFVDNDSHANDQDGHGTHVTGTIAQATNTGSGSTGVPYNSSTMPVRGVGPAATPPHGDIAEALRWAADHGAKIANMSLGGVGGTSTVRGALLTTFNQGMLSFAACGNDADDPDWDTGIDFPANDTFCVAVGSTRYDRTRSYYSQYGPAAELSAPGGDTRVDQDSDGHADGVVQESYSSSFSTFRFYWWQGTSMACPHAVGVAALIASMGVNQPSAIRNLLRETAVDEGPAGWDEQYGYGLINARIALSRLSEGGSGWID